MVQIDPKLMGRTFYVHDQKTTYKFRGLLISGTTLVLGEYEDPQYKCSRLATHKIADVKFNDVFVPTNPLQGVQPT